MNEAATARAERVADDLKNDTPATPDALRTLNDAGGHLVLCAPDKHPIAKRWQSDAPDLDAVLSHAVKGGLVGIIPASVDATVIDVDEGGDQAAAELVAALGEPVLQNATQRAGGAHFWYRSPGGEGGNMKWKYGDVRSARGFAVLWDANALAAAVVTDRFTDAEPADLDALPAREAKGGSDVERMAQAAPGERNDLLNRLAFSWAKRGENLAPLRVAAIDAGLSVDEVSATIRSAEAGANGKAKGKAKGKDTGHGAYAAARAMTEKLAPRAAFVANRGWYIRKTERSLWSTDSDHVMLQNVQNHPARGDCAKGLRSYAISAELEGMLSIPAADLDADDWEAGLPEEAGILDLRTGDVRPATERDRVTMALGAVPEAGEPELFLRVLGDTVSACEDPDGTARYIRWWFRRALTGDCRAEALLFLWGVAGTGKSILAETLLHIAGSYGANVSAANLTGDQMAHREWLARLAGKRIVWLNEPPRAAWRADILLQMVSGEPLVANFMRKDSFEFRSKVALVCTGTDAPTAARNSGYWRRLRQVGARHFPDTPDDTLKGRLRAEAGKILGWLMALPDGPAAPEAPVPAEMLRAAQEAKDAMDPAGQWIDAHLVTDPQGLTIQAGVYSRYLQSVPDDEALNRTRFYGLLMQRFGPLKSARVDGKVTSVRRCSPLVKTEPAGCNL